MAKEEIKKVIKTVSEVKESAQKVTKETAKNLQTGYHATRGVLRKVNDLWQKVVNPNGIQKSLDVTSKGVDIAAKGARIASKGAEALAKSMEKTSTEIKKVGDKIKEK